MNPLSQRSGTVLVQRPAGRPRANSPQLNPEGRNYVVPAMARHLQQSCPAPLTRESRNGLLAGVPLLSTNTSIGAP